VRTILPGYDEDQTIMFIDDITIRVRAGSGGRGAVAFNKIKQALGPAGGSGGKGGSVYCEGVADIGALRHFRHRKDYIAENGKDGKGQWNDGRDGKDLVLTVPVGTVIHDLTNRRDQEVTAIGERVPVATGGKGGKGNFHFRSSRNTSPKQYQPGIPGESAELRLELKLIADVGLVGLPNAGKTSLLNALTNASAKVANYPFTTLEPNLGVYYDLIIADVPGLIEGAADGRGLGVKFLRHIERTRVLFHLVSAELDDPLAAYRAIRAELTAYDKRLAEKREHVFLSKADLVPAEALAAKLAVFPAGKAAPITVTDQSGLQQLRAILERIATEKNKASFADGSD
jgi:GTP-binding protein